MNKITTIALNTFKETIRDRVLYVLLVFSALMFLLSIILGSLSIGNNLKIILDFGLGSINIFGAIIAIFIGTSLIFKEIDRKTVYVILSKPIERWEFILGKFFGLALTLTILIFLMAIMFSIMLLFYKIEYQQLMLAMLSIVLILFELYIITAIAILFSSVSTPLLSMVFTLCLWVIGHFNPTMLSLALFTNNPITIDVVTGLHYILPDLSNFNLKNNIDKVDYVINFLQIGYVIAYGFLYTSLVLFIAIHAFERKEFN